MITIYRLFQLIMGVMLAGFIFYLLLSFAGDYALLGREGIKQKTLDVFLQDVDSVYFTGNPVSFNEFSRDDYTSCHPRPTKPPKISCFIGEKTQETERLLIPVFMRLGDDVLITRGSLDLGWTQLDYVNALTGMTIVFNPRDSDDDTWRIVRDVASAFPDTSGYETKIYFDFCDSSELLIQENMGSPYERREFLSITMTNRDSYSPCTARLSPYQVLVTVSDSCSQSLSDSGICIAPSSDGVGKAYIVGSYEGYIYKDPLDLASLIIGGQRRNVFGEPVGEETWRFKNEFMLKTLETSASIMERRCDWIVQLPSDSVSQECKDIYIELKDCLGRIKALSMGDYQDLTAMQALRSELDEASSLWDQLIDIGCETYGS